MAVNRLLRYVHRQIAVSRWQSRHRDYLVVFNFHQVSPTFTPGPQARSTWTSLQQFEAGLTFIAAQFKVLSLMEALDRLRLGVLRGPCAALTFDDGDSSVADYCLPLLKRLALPACFFINTACFEGKGHYWFSILNHFRECTPPALPCAAAQIESMMRALRTTTEPEAYASLRDKVACLRDKAIIPPRRCVTPEWLADLDERLFSIAAHGHEHERYALMSEEWQHADLRKNVEFLRQFKAFRPVFGFPFGRPYDMNDATMRAAKANRVHVVAADGGINVAHGPVGLRIPADGRVLPDLRAHAMLGW